MKFSSRFTWNTEKNLLTEILDRKRAAHETILDLTESNPTRAGFAYPQDEILTALSQPESMRYEPTPQGLKLAREAICAYYRHHGKPIQADSLFLTASTSEAYSFLFKLLCDPESEIFVPQPGYPLLDFLAELELIRVIPYFSRYNDQDPRWQIDLERLRNSISNKTSAIIMVNPNNPTGAFIKPEELAEINQICITHNLALIVDEVFLDYPSSAIAERGGSCVNNNEALTFVLSGLSKISGLPQIKLGWFQISGPPDLTAAARERLEWIADTYLSVGTPVQHAAGRLLECRKAIQTQIRERIDPNESFLKKQTSKIKNCRVLFREGGWYAILKLDDCSSDESVACNLLEQQNVLIHPGYLFGFQDDGFFVVSLLTKPEAFEEGVIRMDNFMRKI